MKILKRSDILVIGAGHGGCQVADSIANEGICKCIFANSAIGDLNSLLYADDKDKVHFEGGSGSGSIRENGKQFALDNIEEIYRRIETTNAKHIYIIAATAGGTGSGSAIVMAEQIGLRYHPERTAEFRANQHLTELPDRLVHVVAITPSENDNIGIKGFENNVEFLSELKGLVDKGIVRSYTFLDNTTVSNKLEINEMFASDFKELLAVPQLTDGFGAAIDLEDVSIMQSSKGMFQMTQFTLTEKNEKAVNIKKDNYYPMFDKGCKNLLITTNNPDNESFTKHIRGHFGEPEIQTKTGITQSDVNMAFAFGMKFPQSIIQKAKEMYYAKKKAIEAQQTNTTEEIDFKLEAFPKKDDTPNTSALFSISTPDTEVTIEIVKKKSPAQLRAERLAKARGQK